MENYTTYRTAESVSPKHPDKLCDQISDAILDAYLDGDPEARVAVEACGGHGQLFIVGEVTSTSPVSHTNIAKIAHDLGGSDLDITINLVEQSPEIAQGVDTGGAGDQGIMIGYACSETPEMLPHEVILARRLNQYIYAEHPFDGKTQVTIRLDKHAPQKFVITSVVASFQNTPRSELERLVNNFLQPYTLANNFEQHLNPAGDWHQGGFAADTGLTGRKLIVDNYGPRIPIGGGAFSGKDPSKVDRSAAYMARRIAVDYLRARQAHEVFVRLAYAIGHAEPLERSVIVDGVAEQIPSSNYDLTPNGIIRSLELKRPIYEATARYGHFGEGFDWDK